jgi:hypothetical protein
VVCTRSFWWRRRFQAHNLETGIHVKNISGDAAAQIAAEKDGGVRDFGDVRVAAQRSVFLHEIENLGEILNSAGGNRFDGPCGNGVDADFLRAELGGEVADFGLERGFGDAHDVVIFYDARGAEIGESHDRAAVGHEGRKRAGNGDKGIGADVEREFEAVARGFEERLIEIIVICEGEAVDHHVERAAFSFQGFGEVVNVGLLLDVAGEKTFGAKFVAEFFYYWFGAVVLIGEQECGAFARERLGDGVGDAPFIPNAEDDGGFAFQ